MGGIILGRRNQRKKKRNIATREPVEYTYYIFCEGEKTEPLYFKEIAHTIANNAVYKNLVKIIIEGTGRNTTGIVEYAKNFIVQNEISKSSVWCVFDKDDFPDEKFNQATQLAIQYTIQNDQDVSYHVAWSNECIEYWFLLHFCYLDAAINRADYQTRLTEYFQKNGKGFYAKTLSNLFSILTQCGNPKNAIKGAEKRIQAYSQDTVLRHPSQITPGTTVHCLVKELAKYFPDEVKRNYL